MTVRFLLRLLAVVVGAAVLTEILLRPASTTDRWHYAVVFLVPAVVAALSVPLLRRWVDRRRTAAAAALAVGLCSLGLGALTTSAATSAMFVSPHDQRLFLVVLSVSCALALVVGVQLTSSMTTDLARLGEVVDAVGRGDLSVRTGIHRRNEVGRTADAIDQMIAALQRADAERARVATARQMLMTGIGHDLRTPLAAVRATIESLQDHVAVNPEQALEVIDRELGNVQALLDQLTEFARIETGHRRTERRPVSVSEVAHEAVEALTPVARQAEVRLELRADDAGMVAANELDVSRAIRNVVANAIRHTPATRRVEVEVRGHADAGRTGVLVRVADEGEGFPEHFRAQAFDAFTRADPARGGSGHAGLGLAITRSLVLEHAGRVWLGDGPGGEVLMWLPALEQSR